MLSESKEKGFHSEILICFKNVRKHCAHVCVCVMGVFPLENFQGPRDDMEFMREMLHGRSFPSPDSITSCIEFPASGPPRRWLKLHPPGDSRLGLGALRLCGEGRSLDSVTAVGPVKQR